MLQRVITALVLLAILLPAVLSLVRASAFCRGPW